MGNSEVGHLNIGAGRVVMQDLPRIGNAIASGEIAKAPALTDLIGKLKASGGTCHLIGLVSPGGVHSHQDHAAALAKILAEAGVPVLVHALTDGRDTPPQSAGDDIKRLLAALPQVGEDRDRVRPLFRHGPRQALGPCRARPTRRSSKPMAPHFPDAPAVVTDAYANKKFDEFVVPAVVGDYRGMKDGDGVLCFNFRADRVREILGAMLDPDFAGFARQRVVSFAAAVGMTQYSRRARQVHAGDFSAAVASRTSSAKWWRDAGRTQLRMAETEKYPHVTYFLNGGHEEPYRGRRPHHGAVAESRDLRSAAGNVGAGTDRQGGRGDRFRQIRPDHV